MTRLSIDVGNTKTAFGLFEDGRLIDQWRVGTRHWTVDELWILIRSLLELGNSGSPREAAYACVVPQVRHALDNMCSRYLFLEAVEVTVESSGLEIGYKYPFELGADRIANAVGALILGTAPAIIVDFGTATTFDVIDSEGRYAGGAILPGIGTAAGELFRKAEKLHPVDLVFPESVLGGTTADAIRSGVLFGAVGAADHIVELLSQILTESPSLWATGGWAPGVAPHCGSSFSVVPELTLIGIDEIGRRNQVERE